MFLETPGDTYSAYERFLKKGNYKKAYRCLEKILKGFPDDLVILENIINLAFFDMKSDKLARKWLTEITDIRQLWCDYAMLSECEARVGHIKKAREYYKKAVRLQKRQKWLDTAYYNDKKGELQYLKQYIALQEKNILLKNSEKKEKIKNHNLNITVTEHKKEDIRKEKRPSSSNKPKTQTSKQKKQTYSIPIKFSISTEDHIKRFHELKPSSVVCCKLWIDYNHLTVQRNYGELLCLNEVNDIEKFWYQIETVKKVLRTFKGRVLLADEVGMGKTIETGMLIKEYLLRGMITSVLILTPAALVSQWKEEMSAKFKIPFITTDDPLFRTAPEKFWHSKFIIASINTAKSVRYFETVSGRFYDLVVVDEAHHLKNRKTIAWKLVNQLKKRFIFLLSATPVQNNLIELYNLITLLKPGQFKTEKMFKKEYMKRGNPRVPVNREKLQELIKDIMIRNTRSLVDMKLPKRYASTIMVQPSEAEKTIYDRVYTMVKELSAKKFINKMFLNTLLRQAGSSIYTLKAPLVSMKNIKNSYEIDALLQQIDNVSEESKGTALIDIIQKNPTEKKVVFTQYLKTMEFLVHLLNRNGMSCVTFNGSMSNKQKDEAIRIFQDKAPVLVTTEVGGEGRNMQFCNTIINYDLPWNPMKIEQRIGRLYRIGQKRDVFIFNFALKDSIESHILHILDSKINMFEMVIGEIEPILGYYAEDKDFEDIIMDIWKKSSSHKELSYNFEQLGDEMITAKEAYLKTKILDAQIFGEDFEV